MNKFEHEYIEEYNTLVPNGYNLMSGGGNGRVHSLSTRARMSMTRTGKRHKYITRQRISLANKGLVVDKIGRSNIGKASKYRNMSTSNRQRLEKALSEAGIPHLPMYIYFSVDRRGGRNVDMIIVRHPFYKKKFAKKNITLADKIKSAISFIHNGHRSEGSS